MHTFYKHAQIAFCCCFVCVYSFFLVFCRYETDDSILSDNLRDCFNITQKNLQNNFIQSASLVAHWTKNMAKQNIYIYDKNYNNNNTRNRNERHAEKTWYPKGKRRFTVSPQ